MVLRNFRHPAATYQRHKSHIRATGLYQLLPGQPLAAKMGRIGILREVFWPAQLPWIKQSPFQNNRAIVDHNAAFFKLRFRDRVPAQACLPAQQVVKLEIQPVLPARTMPGIMIYGITYAQIELDRQLPVGVSELSCSAKDQSVSK